MQVNQKTVLITGGGSGIGLAIAQQFLINQANVIIVGRNKEKLAKAKTKHPKLETIVCDISDTTQVKELANQLKNKGGIDILVNNAGVFETVDYTTPEQELTAQQREIDINFMGPVKMVTTFLPLLKERKEAAILNVSSGLAFVPLTAAPVYSGTKAGLHSWTRSLRYQLQETTVKVFEVMPPLVETEMVADFEGQKKMDANKLAEEVLKGIKANHYEITPGQSSQLKMMSRFAPNFIFKMLNKQMAVN